jgi:V/A-type H+-transporting ATPase subunit I
MSYIRLWAVSLAGAAIASTVNGFVGSIASSMMIFLAIVLILLLCSVGHGLNLVLNVLSVLVHGIRLNTLEFSSHMGLSWSGFRYKPLAKNV